MGDVHMSQGGATAKAVWTCYGDRLSENSALQVIGSAREPTNVPSGFRFHGRGVSFSSSRLDQDLSRRACFTSRRVLPITDALGP
jgi:hypothetical protein